MFNVRIKKNIILPMIFIMAVMLLLLFTDRVYADTAEGYTEDTKINAEQTIDESAALNSAGDEIDPEEAGADELSGEDEALIGDQAGKATDVAEAPEEEQAASGEEITGDITEGGSSGEEISGETTDEGKNTENNDDTDDPDPSGDGGNVMDDPEDVTEPEQEDPEPAPSIVAGDDGKFYEDGVLKTNCWIEYDGKRFFADANGNLYRNQFIRFGSTYYYMGSDGSVQTGIVSAVGNKLYFAEENGVVRRTAGWIEQSDSRFFSADGGELYKNQFIHFGRTYYYMGSDGSVQTGIVSAVGNKLYFAEANGVVRRTAGWINHDGDRFFARDGGELYANQFIHFGSTYYFLGSDGSVMSGVLYTPGNKLYFADEKGVVKRTPGWINYDGRKYFAQNGGELYHDRFIHFGSIYYYMGYDGAAVTGEMTIAGRNYTFREDGTMIGKPQPPLKGIDVSEFQGAIDWNAVKNSGIDFAFVRVGGRGGTSGNTYMDEKFKENIIGAIKSSIQVGVYFFTQAINTNEAVQEANLICDQVKGYEISLPVVIDTESLIIDGIPCRHDRISAQQRTEVVRAFCDQVIERGYTPMIYGSTSWLEDELYMSQLPYKVWVAQYYDVCQYEGDYSFWQYSETGTVNGIYGYVDMNYWVS